MDYYKWHGNLQANFKWFRTLKATQKFSGRLLPIEAPDFEFYGWVLREHDQGFHEFCSVWKIVSDICHVAGVALFWVSKMGRDIQRLHHQYICRKRDVSHRFTLAKSESLLEWIER